MKHCGTIRKFHVSDNRYERVCLSQRNGFETRHRRHKTDWKAFKADPNSINLPQPDWLYGFDAEGYTIDRWDEVVKHMTEGVPFKSTNVPEGHVHQEWSVAGVMEQEKHMAKPLDVKTWGNTKSKRDEVAIHIETLTISDEQEA
jgi:hypothetical protein